MFHFGLLSTHLPYLLLAMFYMAVYGVHSFKKVDTSDTTAAKVLVQPAKQHKLATQRTCTYGTVGQALNKLAAQLGKQPLPKPRLITQETDSPHALFYPGPLSGGHTGHQQTRPPPSSFLV